MLKKLGKFIDVKSYSETFESNLNKDEIAKGFWVNQLPLLINKFAKKASEHELQSETAQLRAENYKTEYTNEINNLFNKKDFLSVRMLLELNEIFLKKNGFKDVWKLQKDQENSLALRLLSKRLEEIDSIKDHQERWIEIVKGLLAGNIFDSGATAVQDLLNDNDNFGLEEALQQIPDRPWLIDTFDDFLVRLSTKPPHACAAIFCDNSGVDCILGVLPFARELLKNNTKVILSANSEPSLNDVTYVELSAIIENATKTCAILRESYQNKNLCIFASGQKGCCLNFLNLDENLIDKMIESKVDLIVIEGMGRSLHTNLNSKFLCDSLKLAVIKNKFLASRLGGTLFDSICKYEAGSADST